MTNEEAIERLKGILNGYEDLSEEDAEALNMAIEALEFDDAE